MRIVTIDHDQESFRFRIPTKKDWGDLAEYLTPLLKPGSIVTLSGPLGAGKTTFVQILAKRFGVKKNPSSPTFALMKTYALPGHRTIKRLLHVDAYRLETERELMALDLDEELSDGKTIVVIEWPEKIETWLAGKAVFQVKIALEVDPNEEDDV